MTVSELQAALQAAVDRGLPGDTTVVVETGHWFTVVDSTTDPTQTTDFDMWFTLALGQEADSRTTPGGMP